MCVEGEIETYSGWENKLSRSEALSLLCLGMILCAELMGNRRELQAGSDTDHRHPDPDAVTDLVVTSAFTQEEQFST